MKLSKLALTAMLLGGAALAFSGCSGSDGAVSSNVGARAMGGKSGGDGYGGNGGVISVFMAGGTGDIVLGKPIANKTVTPPTQAEIDAHADFGPQKLLVSSDVTFVGITSDFEPEPEDGTPYIYGETLYISDKDTEDGLAGGGEIVVTGVEVAKGATLTIENGIGEGGSAYFWLDGSFVNKGTVTGERLDFDAGLDFINQSGATIRATDLAYMWAYAYFANSGTIDISGEAGADAGWISFKGYSAVINTGVIKADGGDSADGDGGNAGDITLVSCGDLLNSGALSATGGSGATGAGDGRFARLYAGYCESTGGLINTGNIDVSGGDLTDVAGTAGMGGNIEMFSWHDSLYTKSTLTARGGNGTSTTAGNNGGTGGSVSIVARGNNDADGMHVAVGGGIDASGGDSRNGSGGNTGDFEGGSINIVLQQFEPPTTADTVEVSFTRFDASGSDGAAGGSGGAINVFFPKADSGETDKGEIKNSAAIIATGGDSSAPGINGGNGGSVSITLGVEPGGYEIANTGAMDVSGGDANDTAEGEQTGGRGGKIGMYSMNILDTASNLTSKGGDAPKGLGGQGGFIDLGSFADFVAGGSMNVNGGTGLAGGMGGGVKAQAGINADNAYIRFRASASANGGAVAGAGGCVYVNNWNSSSDAEVSGALSAKGHVVSGESTDGDIYTLDAWTQQGGNNTCIPYLD